MSLEKLDTQARQQQIRLAALQLIATHGVARLSVAALARQVGLSPGAIYRHFKSKGDVLDATLNLIGEMLLTTVRAARSEATSSLDVLHRLLVRHVQLIRENSAIPRIVFSEEVFSGAPERKARIHEIIRSYLEAVAKIVREGQDRDEIRRNLEPDTVALLFLGIIQPAAILWHVSEGRFHATRHAELAWKLLRQAIAHAEAATTAKEATA